MKALKDISFVASGGGRYIVFRDGEEVSEHNALHKAQEKATNQKVTYPDSKVWYEQTLRVDCDANFEDVFTEGDIVAEGSFTTIDK